VPREPPFLEIEGRSLSWREIESNAAATAGRLASLGIGRGDIVCQMAGNTLGHVATVFALARLGAIECPVNTALRGEPLRHVLAHSGAVAVIVEAAQLERVEEAVAALRDGPRVIARGVDPPAKLARTHGAVREEELDHRDTPTAQVSPSDPATIMYTSGTTGPAKGVVLPHHFAFSAAAVKIGTWGLSSDDVFFTPLPLFHSNARYSTLLTAAIVGGRAVVVDRFSASRFWEQVRACGATEVGTVGTVAPILLERPPSPGDRLHQVRMIHGAGALPVDARTRFEERFGVRLVTGFAMTETSHFATTAPDDSSRHAASGRPVKPFQVAILGDDDSPLPPGAVGEIAVRAEAPLAMFTAYHRQPDATQEAFRNHWFHTGDIGYLDEDGLLHWVDRKKDAIRRRGEMISSRDVEAAALAFTTVGDAAAIGVPGELGEEEVELVVRARDGETIDLKALAEHCRRELPDFAVPRFYAIVDDLPRTSTHKIDKKQLRAAAPESVWDARATTEIASPPGGS
jgi:crotonobetaine/carnitine-CoA ligase